MVSSVIILDFAGLQNGNQCFCGDNPGTHSFSQTCDVDCVRQNTMICYGGSGLCKCGGTSDNDIYRTSTSVSCPSETEESYAYLGCYGDEVGNRVMETYAVRDVLIPECVALCRDMGFRTLLGWVWLLS